MIIVYPAFYRCNAEILPGVADFRYQPKMSQHRISNTGNYKIIIAGMIIFVLRVVCFSTLCTALLSIKYLLKTDQKYDVSRFKQIDLFFMMLICFG